MTFNLRTLAAAAAIVALASAAPRAAEPEGYANPHLITSAGQLAGLAGAPDLRIIDVRPRDAYDEGHIPGAIHLAADAVTDPDAQVDGARLPDDRLAALFGERGIGKSTRVVLYDDKGGFHAARLFWMLEYLGHRHASVLDGGIGAWTAAGGSLSTEPGQAPALRLSPTPSARREASADWLLERQDDASVMVIDVRPAEAFAKGHIPWATNIPWKANLAPDGTMKPAAELAAHFAALGVTPEKNIAVHCQNGKASAHSYYALRLLGYPRVRTYDRSWAEWGTSDDLPKAASGGR